MLDLVAGPDRGHRISCQNMECSGEKKNKRLFESSARAISTGSGDRAGSPTSKAVEWARQAPDFFAFSPWFTTANQWGRIDHAEPFAYLSVGCLKSWRLCGIALALSFERACLHAKRLGRIWDLRPKRRKLIRQSGMLSRERAPRRPAASRS